jgi:chemotaxis family two-component system sensor kinase Cph1
MVLHQSAVEVMIDSMTPSVEQIRSRKDFLEFGEREASLLKELGPMLAPLEDAFVESFYGHLEAHPETHALMGSPERVTHLKQKQREYFEQLLSGEYGPDYVKSRMRVGVIHQQIGLEPRWYLGAYGKYLSWLLPEVLRHANNDPERFLDYTQALIKATLFDCELSLTAYFHADHEMLRLLAQVFESNLEVVMITDLEGHILHANKSVTSITGHIPEELIGSLLCNLHAKGQDELCNTVWGTVVSGGQWQGEIREKRKSGEEYPAWMNLSAVKDSTGKVTHVIAEFSDITAFKQTQEALARRTEELASSNQELEQFAYVASHDLQEPLRMVASYTQLLARRYKDKLDDDANEFIHYAVDGATRMQALINDLLELSRIGTSRKALATCESGLALERALANLRLAIQESGALVTHDTMPHLVADVSQLTQLFQNLIGNALKFRGEAPLAIHIGVKRQKDDWVFSVRDNGIGIAPEFFERIFVIFQRLHGKQEYPGTGIGLAVCRKIVERHGGHIWLESKPDEGATFYFTLPARTKTKEESSHAD